MLLNLVTPLHTATKRDYLARMNDDKVHCMGVAKKYGEDYWDGNRRYGYGGYKYIPGRWQPVAEGLVNQYQLRTGYRPSRILDVGCGKGFLLHEISKLLPTAELVGFDVSEHGLAEVPAGIKRLHYDARDPLPFDTDYFDLVISLGCLHNLKIFDLERAVKEIHRVGRNQYIMVESFRNDQELFNLQCWALTCQAFYSTEEWIWLYRHFGYTGDYEFIYFE